MAFDTAVSGLRAASTNLSIVGNNVANAGTTGFKSSRGEFTDVYATSLLGINSNSIGQGVALSNVNQTFSQGNISFTDNSMDMAINGEGFFALNNNGTPTYSRAGSFQIDRDGYVVNNVGHRLVSFTATDSGEMSDETADLRIDTALVEPQNTDTADMVLNLDSREAEPLLPFGTYDAFATPATSPDPESYNASSAMTIYDSLGNPHVLSTFYVKTAVANEWEVHGMIDGVSVTLNNSGGNNTLSFDSSGQLPTAALPAEYTISGWTPLNELGAANGANTQDLVVDLSASTQFGAEFAVNSASQDGFSAGQLNNVEVADGGVIFGRYTNGESRMLGQVALAKFPNTSGLQSIGNTAWAETHLSGQPTLTVSGESGVGIIQSGALEDSNVEITEQLVEMIVAQRDFQANAQVIQTEDAITQTVINLR